MIFRILENEINITKNMMIVPLILIAVTVTSMIIRDSKAYIAWGSLVFADCALITDYLMHIKSYSKLYSKAILDPLMTEQKYRSEYDELNIKLRKKEILIISSAIILIVIVRIVGLTFRYDGMYENAGVFLHTVTLMLMKKHKFIIEHNS